MDALGHVLDLQPVSQLLGSIVEVLILSVVEMFLLQSPDKRSAKPFSVG